MTVIQRECRSCLLLGFWGMVLDQWAVVLDFFWVCFLSHWARTQWLGRWQRTLAVLIWFSTKQGLLFLLSEWHLHGHRWSAILLVVSSLTSYLGTAHESVLILTSGWFSIHIRLTIIPNVPNGRMSSGHLSGVGHCAHPTGCAPSLQLFGHLELPVKMYTRKQQNFLTNISDYHQVSLLILRIQREKASWNVLLIVLLKLFFFFFWPGEMFLCLIAFSALAEDLGLVLGIHIKWLAIAYKSSFMGTGVFSGLCGNRHILGVHTYT